MSAAAADKSLSLSRKRLDLDAFPAAATAVYKRTRRLRSNSVKHEQETEEQDHSAAGPDPLALLRCTSEPWRPPQTSSSGRGTFRIGTSGYIYSHWKGVIYPKGVPQKEWFRIYTHLFDTVEINNTFYRLPSSEVFQSWHDQAPSGFCYALKYSKYGTHLKRLKDPDGHVSLFLDRSLPLKDFCGPILVQLPPKFDLNLDRLKAFFQRTPSTCRWALEVRDTRWLCDEVYSLLKAHNVALCIHDHEDIPITHPKVITADWLYLRFHGQNYKHNYTTQQLEEYAAWIQDQLSKGMDVFAYFNNDFCGYAVLNALTMRKLILGASSTTAWNLCKEL